MGYRRISYVLYQKGYRGIRKNSILRYNYIYSIYQKGKIRENRINRKFKTVVKDIMIYESLWFRIFDFMDLYNIKGNNLKSVDVNQFKLEKEIQQLVENNTEELFGLEFVSSEFKIGEFRIDTLCFDKENNSFVIIEYKKGSSYSVIDQGYSYLSVMLNSKSDFILEYNESKEKQIKRNDVDWTQSKIIFVSPSFNSYQKNSVNFKDVPFELWEIKRFSNNIISLNQHISKSTESINKVSTGKNTVINKVNKEVKVHTEEDFINYIGKDLIEPYNKLKDRLISLSDVEIKFKLNYVSVWKGKSVVVYINKGKKYLSVDMVSSVDWGGKVNEKESFILNDSKNYFKLYESEYKKIYYHHLTKETDTDYLFLMIKQKFDSMN